MSHFTVLVVGSDVEGQLAPFQETGSGHEADRFLQDIDKTASILEEYNKHTVSRLRAPDGTLHSFFDAAGEWREEFSIPDTDDPLGMQLKRRKRFVPPGYEEVTLPAAEAGESLIAYCSEYHSLPAINECQSPNLTGAHKYGYSVFSHSGELLRAIDRTNPNGKWDWWEVGGRWNGFLWLTNGQRADSAEKGDVDTAAMEQHVADEARKRWAVFSKAVAGTPPAVPWKHFMHQVGEQLISWDEARAQYGEQPRVKALRVREVQDVLGWRASADDFPTTEAEYVAAAVASAFSTFAVVKDGVWAARGEMGWWACVSDEQNGWPQQFRRIWDSIPATERVTIVDCHV